jgi:hypothetical protein
MARQPRDPWLQEILDAVRERRIGADAAVEWLTMRADEAAREARRARAAGQRGHLGLVPSPGEMSNQEADALLPPRTAEEFERRARLADVHAAAVEDLTDAEIYDAIFGRDE